jgi:tripartite-type tricarboxylate transporter receptor subunit TctC
VGPYKSGRLRALAVTSPKRSGAFPDVPTMDELGYKGFDSTGWFELMGPAGMPPELVARLSQALLKAGEDKNLQEQFKQLGCDAEFLTPAQTVEKVKSDYAKWGKVIKDANIKAD